MEIDGKNLLTLNLPAEELKTEEVYVREGTLDEYVIVEVFKRKIYEREFDIAEGELWLDIGAHIGSFSLKCFYNGADAIGYEPNKVNFDIAKMNLEGTDQELHQLAIVGNDDLSRELFLNVKKNTGAHSFYINKRRKTTETVKCININEILHDGVDGIKLDVEGAEVEILEAIIDFKNVKKIVYEYHHNVMGQDSYLPIINILQKAGFEVIYNSTPGGAWTTMVYAVRDL